MAIASALWDLVEPQGTLRRELPSLVVRYRAFKAA